MAIALGNVVPSLASINTKNVTTTLLDFVFRDCALLLQDPAAFYSFGLSPVSNKSVPLPIIGFTFQMPEHLELLKYTYAEYPYLNKAVVANAVMRESTSITIRALRPIVRGNTIVTNWVFSGLLETAIRAYADAGGLFTLNTMWGFVRDLALESLSAEPVEGQPVGWVFTFKKLNFVTASSIESVSDKLSKIYNGAG